MKSILWNKFYYWIPNYIRIRYILGTISCSLYYIVYYYYHKTHDTRKCISIVFFFFNFIDIYISGLEKLVSRPMGANCYCTHTLTHVYINYEEDHVPIEKHNNWSTFNFFFTFWVWMSIQSNPTEEFLASIKPWYIAQWGIRDALHSIVTQSSTEYTYQDGYVEVDTHYTRISYMDKSFEAQCITIVIYIHVCLYMNEYKKHQKLCARSANTTHTNAYYTIYVLALAHI